jgi:hypothetical protein
MWVFDQLGGNLQLIADECVGEASGIGYRLMRSPHGVHKGIGAPLPRPTLLGREAINMPASVLERGAVPVAQTRSVALRSESILDDPFMVFRIHGAVLPQVRATNARALASASAIRNLVLQTTLVSSLD